MTLKGKKGPAPLMAGEADEVRIEHIDLNEIKIDPPDTNPKAHGQRNLEMIQTSVQEFGPLRSGVVNKDRKSLAGTGLVTAARAAGKTKGIIIKPPKDTVVFVEAADLTPEQERRYALVDNITHDGEYNQRVIESMQAEGLTTGFEEEMARIMSSGILNTGNGNGDGTDGKEDKGSKIDLAAELVKKFDVKVGQIWEIPSQTARGDAHRIMCGSSDNRENVRRLMSGERAQLFGTDPPYAVAYDGKNHPHMWKGRDKERDAARKQLPAPVIEALEIQLAAEKEGDTGEEFDPGAVPQDLEVQQLITSAEYENEFYGEWDSLTPEEAAKLWVDYNLIAVQEALAPNAAWYCCHASKHQALLEKCWNHAGAFMHQQFIWVKNRPIFTRSWAMWQHEPIMMGWLKGNKPARVTRDYERTTWMIDTIKPGEHGLHPTEKPTEIFTRMMKQHSKPGSISYEPFSGSGTQLISGEMNRVIVFAMERSPRWVAVSLQRMEDYGLFPQLVEEL